MSRSTAAARVVDVSAAPAHGAHDVVVMDRLAGDVRVLAGRQVDALDGMQLGQDVERPEDRRPADAEPVGPGVGDEIGGGEVPVPVGDERRDRPPRAGQAIAGVVERARTASGAVMGATIALSLMSADVQIRRQRGPGTGAARDHRRAAGPYPTAPDL